MKLSRIQKKAEDKETSQFLGPSVAVAVPFLVRPVSTDTASMHDTVRVFCYRICLIYHSSCRVHCNRRSPRRSPMVLWRQPSLSAARHLRSTQLDLEGYIACT